MRLHHSMLRLLLATGLLFAACTSRQDAELGDNPVLGSEGPGAIADSDSTSYGLLALIALGLIVVGLLLVKAESWQRKRQ